MMFQGDSFNRGTDLNFEKLVSEIEEHFKLKPSFKDLKLRILDIIIDAARESEEILKSNDLKKTHDDEKIMEAGIYVEKIFDLFEFINNSTVETAQDFIHEMKKQLKRISEEQTLTQRSFNAIQANQFFAAHKKMLVDLKEAQEFNRVEERKLLAKEIYKLGSQIRSDKFQYPVIANEETFTDFVCDIYNSIHPTAHFHRFGKRGHNQKGIDLLSIVRREAIQCKKKEISRKGLVNELKRDFESDVQNALDLKIDIDLLIFASTYKDSTELSEYLQELKRKIKPSFNLMYVGWEHLTSGAQNYQRIIEKYFGISHEEKSLSLQKNKEDRKKFIPPTYLENLPAIKYKAYIEAHKLWDKGVTSEMLAGNYLFADKLKKVLVDLAETAYSYDYFNGKSVEDFYTEKIKRLMEAAYESQPFETGTMHIVIASSQLGELINDYIVDLVKDVTDPVYFQKWKLKWDKATKAGRSGQEIDLDTNKEF